MRALGLVLYELLTHRPPFRGETDLETFETILRGPPPPPSRLDSDIPPAVDAIVLRAAASRKEDRFATAADLGQAIEEHLASVPQDSSSASLAQFMHQRYADHLAAQGELPVLLRRPRLPKR